MQSNAMKTPTFNVNIEYYIKKTTVQLRYTGQFKWYKNIGIFLSLLSVSVIGIWNTDSQVNKVNSTTDQPNIVLIVADDLGSYDLGCYGNPVIETPRLDELAANGIKFNKAYAAIPICSPSRAAIVTGLNPSRIALTEHIRGFVAPDPCWPLIPPRTLQRLPLAYETVAEALKENQYRTAYVGKWHLGGGAYKPTSHGYDQSYAAGGAGLPQSFFPPYFGNNAFPELYSIASNDSFLTDALTTLAIHSIRDGKEPFFLHLNYYSPHVPIMGPPDLVEKYEAKINGDPDTLPRPHYAAMVERIDQQVGRLIDTLTNRGLIENTIILFTSDHGALTVQEVPGFDEHTPPTTNGILREGKGSLYEGGLRVPLIAYGSGIQVSVDEKQTINTDLFPTITELAGNPKHTPDGVPIESLTGIKQEARELYWHYPHYSPQGGHPGGAVISGRYKLIEWSTVEDSVSLFDLENDPGEKDNIAIDDPDRVLELRDALMFFRNATGARLMAPNPTYDPNNCD